MESIDKIKKIYTALSKSKKEDVKYELHKIFGISTTTINNLWFYAGTIPDDKVLRVLNIVISKMKEQITESQSLIDV